MTEPSSPFQPPQAELLAADQLKPSRWWLAYGWLLLAITCLGLVRSAFNPFLAGPWLVLFLAASIPNIWGLAGLWLYIKGIPLGPRAAWYVCAVLNILQILYVTYTYVRMGQQIGWATEKALFSSNLVSLILMLPLPYAVWRYASDAALWQRRQTPSGSVHG